MSSTTLTGTSSTTPSWSGSSDALAAGARRSASIVPLSTMPEGVVTSWPCDAARRSGS
jgi:hypothetical protein